MVGKLFSEMYTPRCATCVTRRAQGSGYHTLTCSPLPPAGELETNTSKYVVCFTVPYMPQSLHFYYDVVFLFFGLLGAAWPGISAILSSEAFHQV